MRLPIWRKSFFLVAGVVLFFAGWAVGKDDFTTRKTTLHCATWTAKPGLTQAEFDQFKTKLGKLQELFPGFHGIWIGKLLAPVTLNNEKRDHGIVLEFENAAAKDAYSKSPRREEWVKLFEEVRMPGSTFFDVVGE